MEENIFIDEIIETACWEGSKKMAIIIADTNIFFEPLDNKSCRFY